MKIEILNVTPKMAREFLKTNTANRPLRRTVVESFKLALVRGEYVMTHQGVAFAADGTLLDGQHRLTAISEMDGGTLVPMVVTTGLDPAAFMGMDIGVKRTAADVLHEDKPLVEAARFMAALYAGKTIGVSPAYLIPFIEYIRVRHDDLMAFCGQKVKMWSSAPVRSAALIAMDRGSDSDYVRNVYRALVKSDFNAMPSVAQALYKSYVAGSVNASASTDAFVRCLKVFDHRQANLKMVKMIDPAQAVAEFRELMVLRIDGLVMPEPPKKKAPPVKAPKGSSGFNFSASAQG